MLNNSFGPRIVLKLYDNKIRPYPLVLTFIIYGDVSWKQIATKLIILSCQDENVMVGKVVRIKFCVVYLFT